MQLIVSYTGTGRECRRFLQSLLLAGVATEIKKINYVHSYTAVNKKLTKTEEKMLIISYEKGIKDKLIGMINKGGDKVKINNVSL